MYVKIKQTRVFWYVLLICFVNFRKMRATARKNNIKILDAEAIKYQYVFFFLSYYEIAIFVFVEFVSNVV